MLTWVIGISAVASFLLLQVPCCCRSLAEACVAFLSEQSFSCCRLLDVVGVLLLQQPCCCMSPAVASGLAIANVLLMASLLSEQSSPAVAGFSMLRMSCSAIRDKNYRSSNKRQAVNMDKKL